jgi:arylesterase/paraoxonase
VKNVKIIKFIFIGIIALVAIAAVGVMGYLSFSQDEPHFAGQCKVLELDESSEDIQIDRARGFAYLSMIDRGALAKGEPAQGSIGRLDLNDKAGSVEPALINPPGHFRPHGLSLFIDDAGQRWMVVINHPVDRTTGQDLVELFSETAPGQFKHVETFTVPMIENANDLVAVGPRQFYVAQDNGASRDGSLTELVYVDNGKAAAVADDIASGGGINVSADLGTLYLAETGGQVIRVLSRNSEDGSVTTTNRIPIGTSPDNIDIAEDGSLWVGAHSNLLALVFHFILGTDAPSQILQIKLDAGGNATIDEIYLNHGDEISASSVGATTGKKLLIGSITAPRILICERD